MAKPKPRPIRVTVAPLPRVFAVNQNEPLPKPWQNRSETGQQSSIGRAKSRQENCWIWPCCTCGSLCLP